MIIATSTVLAMAEEEIQAATVPPITFVVTAIIGIAIILLGFDLVRRVRRAQYRAEIQQSLEAEIAERDSTVSADGGLTGEVQGAGADTGAAVDPAIAASDDEGLRDEARGDEARGDEARGDEARGDEARGDGIGDDEAAGQRD